MCICDVYIMYAIIPIYIHMRNLIKYNKFLTVCRVFIKTNKKQLIDSVLSEFTPLFVSQTLAFNDAQ
jgi:uncharacterized membrane protein YcfT